MNNGKKYSFIVIDDHPLIRDGIINFIKADDRFEFIGEFDDTRPVLNSTLAGKPDLIILDLNLNNVDAANSCRPIKQRFPECKVVAYTHYEGREKELIKQGFDGYMIKTEKYSLIDVLISVLNGNKYFKDRDKKEVPATRETAMTDTFFRFQQLTPREKDVAKLIAEDYSNRQIGEKLFISEATVETHRKHIKEKLGAKSPRDLYTILHACGL